MNEKIATSSTIEPRKPITQTTKYYTIIGKHDYLDRTGCSDEKDKDGNFIDSGYPCQLIEDKFTYAKETGRRRLIRLDRNTELYNPDGLYTQYRTDDRWVQVDGPTFTQYINFLKTRNPLFFRQAVRGAK